MKQFWIAVVFFALASTLGARLGAQIIHDPNDRIYKDIDRWAANGYITQSLPLIRPYPLQLIDELLDAVIERGGVEDREKAAAYKAEFSRGSRFLHAGVQAEVVGQDGDTMLTFAPAIDGAFRLMDWITASYFFSFYASESKPGEELRVPGTYSPFPDLILDNVNAGKFWFYPDWTSATAFGSGSLYFQAGVNRTAIGPFYENSTVVGPQAGRAGHFSLNVRRPKGSFEMLLMTLAASNDFGDGRFPNKYLIFHSINFNPLPNLEFGLQESVIWGGRMEYLYLVPFAVLFTSQALSDFGDNSFIGFHIRWDIPGNIRLLGQVYVDDFHMNDFMRFKWNTKYKFSGQVGLAWAPPESPLASLQADYTIIFPYMYSHWNVPETDRYEVEKPNYLIYSHGGRNLGSELDPNSHKISLKSSWRTIRNLDVSATLYFTQHGNASGNVPDSDWENSGERHDGSIYDDGSTKDGNNYSEIRFLTQNTLDTRLAAGLGVAWRLPFFSFGEFSLFANYVFEYGWNRNLVRDNNGVVNYWSVGGSWRW
ncbi:MAG: capsule assembly Wzi family protein [Treponema sp.]|nr:capsule assembly Wzi family protein [Treponema sp.]